MLEASGDGQIVTIGSIAGSEPYPGGAGYNAAKFAVRAVMGVLRQELLGRPVRVCEIDPGMVETEFSLVRFGGDADRAAAVYEGVEPLTAEDVAECVRWVGVPTVPRQRRPARRAGARPGGRPPGPPRPTPPPSGDATSGSAAGGGRHERPRPLATKREASAGVVSGAGPRSGTTSARAAVERAATRPQLGAAARARQAGLAVHVQPLLVAALAPGDVR